MKLRISALQSMAEAGARRSAAQVARRAREHAETALRVLERDLERVSRAEQADRDELARESKAFRKAAKAELGDVVLDQRNFAENDAKLEFEAGQIGSLRLLARLRLHHPGGDCHAR